MAHVYADLVRETSTTTGTGALTLDGAPTGFQAFSAVCSNNDTAWVAIRHQTADEWEVCLGTWGTGGILTRTTTIQSSNAGSAVNFSSGTLDVFITAPADKTMVVDAAGLATPASPAFTTPNIGTPSAGTLTSCTGLPLSTGVTGTLPVANGGSGRNTATTAYGLLAAGTTATGAHQTLAAGATTEILVGGGASALPVWTAATGSGAPVRATSPTLVTPALGTPTSGTLTGCTGLPLTTGVTGTLGVTNGGTGRATGTTAYALVATGTTATGVQQSLAAGATTEILVGGGASALPVWTTAQGSGSPVRATSPTLTTPVLGVATATSINKVAITTPATSAILDISDLKTLRVENSLTFRGTDGSTLAVGAGGTLGTAAYTASTAYLAAAGTAANSSQLLGATWAAPGTIGSGTHNTGKFTTLEATGLITATGGQIKFPATQSASSDVNTLDDYEEGTWTPNDQSGASLSFTAAIGSYTKVGRKVTVHGAVTYPSTANTAAAIIGGLPFTLNATYNGIGSCYTTSGTALAVLGQTSQTNQFPLNAATGATVTNASLSTTTVAWTMTYEV